MIELKNIGVTFGAGTNMERKALKGVNLKIAKGEYITVIGTNGAGKTTLLNLIAGEIPVSGGAIRIDNDNVTRWPGYKRSKDVARVFQDPLAGTCGDLTIAENMALAARRGRRRGVSRAQNRHLREEFRSRLAELRLGLEARLDTEMSMLSGGQRQAVSLVMATMAPLKILLLDEHTSALDPKTAAFVCDLTQRIVEQHHLTTLQVTHSLNQALHYGTRTVMLHEGRMIYDVSGTERSSLTVADLLQKFGQSVDDDRLLLGS